jgi:hypothetical protein
MASKTISEQHPLLEGGCRKEREAARFLGVGYQAMKAARLQGRPYAPYLKIGGTILYRNEDLLRCLEEAYHLI